MWGYLAEFWNAITGVVVEAGNYTADFFQSIGNSVAGALGGVFDWLLHFLWDGLTFIRWILSAFSQVFSFLTAPLSYFYQFLKSFFLNVIKPPVPFSNELGTYASSTREIFAVIPYWDTITIVIGVSILVFGAIGIVFLFLKIR